MAPPADGPGHFEPVARLTPCVDYAMVMCGQGFCLLGSRCRSSGPAASQVTESVTPPDSVVLLPMPNTVSGSGDGSRTSLGHLELVVSWEDRQKKRQPQPGLGRS